MENVAVKTMSVVEAGLRYYGLGKDASYRAAKRGDIPFMYVGRLMKTTDAAMDRKLAEEGLGEVGET